MKQNIDACLAEYKTKELIQFHANLNALYLGCSEDFHLFKLLLAVHFEIVRRNESPCKLYLRSVEQAMKEFNT